MTLSRLTLEIGLRIGGQDARVTLTEHERPDFKNPENINWKWHVIEEHFAKHLGTHATERTGR